eukprot:TRINITY_DN15015_c0_g1_i1.p2 TRINITY_DN15015_c0_g1~~TRINITY_DN15015_c0_g1_i1.p2  ORF type:complete len:138 (-),score=7.21 TRINITY_DN15015_c0_g1_i1:11-424(-)
MRAPKTASSVSLHPSVVLFELFDFNGIGSLSVTDFEHLLRCCVTSACRLHNLSWDPFSLSELAAYLSETFDEDRRINFPRVLKYCASDQFVGAFLRLFKIPEIERKFVARIDSLLASSKENEDASQLPQCASNLFII